MNKDILHLLLEINTRKVNLEVKRQVQTAENDKELEILMLWESSLEAISKDPPKNMVLSHGDEAFHK